MIWVVSHRCDPEVRPLADRHYNRQSVGTPNFVPPGRCLVLKAGRPVSAFWVSSWPFAEYVRHRWAGAWVCSAFRRESGEEKASHMIRDALACTAEKWPIPDLGMVTFIDRRHVRPVKVRGRQTWGRTWELAGFEFDGETKGGLLAYRISPDAMPKPETPRGSTPDLWRAKG